MNDINELLNEIIPPNDYQNRNGFGNENIIASLSDSEKLEVEKRLIQMLNKNDDTLIGETLMILKSKTSLPILRERLERAKKSSEKIIWASFINEINSGDDEMKNIALKEFDNVTEKYTLLSIFHYLARFNDSRIKEKILSFTDHNDYLIAYNARTSIGIDIKDLITREKRKRKRWWQFWKPHKASS